MQGIPKKRFGLSCCPAAGACKVDVGTDGVFRGLCAARCPRLATNGQWEEICFAKLGALVGCSETWKTSRMISVMCRFMSCEVISVRQAPDVHAAYSAEADRLFRRNVTGYSADFALAGFSTLVGHDRSRFGGM
jgi:hypothetical protein